MSVLTSSQIKELGPKVRVARLAKKLTQQQLSSKVGQHFSKIAKLEVGEFSGLNDTCIREICKILEIDLGK